MADHPLVLTNGQGEVFSLFKIPDNLLFFKITELFQLGESGLFKGP